MKTGIIFILLIYLFCCKNVIGQDSVRVMKIIPGAKYKAGFLNEIFLGKHWRNLWTTQISAPELNLRSFAGGLEPYKKGGGLQTKSLRLKGKDGNEYKFRSLDKHPSRSLPDEFKNSVYADLLQDQVSIGLPVSSLIVYPLMKKTGVLCVKPKLVILPDDDKLGIFRKDFGNVPGFIEQNPRAGKKGFNDFENADKVLSGFEIFRKTEKDNDEQVLQTEFLKARLLDIFIGDRDRHADQWQWAGYKKDGKREWIPIPRDRDYAFGKYDGIFPWLAGLLVHSLVGFNADIPSVLELTWSGRHLDRRYLNGISKSTWDSVTNNLIQNLPDNVIEDAVRQMPEEMFAKEGRNLIYMLKSRRKQLKKASDEYYYLVSDVTDVYGSNKNEFAEVNTLNEYQVELKLYQRDKSGLKKGEPFFKKVYDSRHTNEIRLNLLDGDDSIYINGRKENDILLRIISGKGKDILKNESDIKIKLYDNNSNTSIYSSDNIYWNNDKPEKPEKANDKYEPPVEDRYGFWAFTPVLNYNSDDGFIAGGGPNYVQFGFRANPYLYYWQLTGAYATIVKDYELKFYSDFNKLIHNSRVELFLTSSGLEFNRYYGKGNETVRIDSLADVNFYKTNQQDLIVNPKLTLPLQKNLKVNFNLIYRYTNIRQKNDTNFLLGITKPYGYGKTSGISFATGISFDNTEMSLLPEHGFQTYVNVLFYPGILDYKNSFTKLNSGFNAYAGINTFTEINFILKTGGEIIFGEYPFFEASSVGGQKSLRGFSRERFQGDASVFGQSEIRIKLAALNLLLPAKLGLSATGDIGRVFIKDENSKKWHSTFGGGIWLDIVRAVEMNFLVGVSPEVTKYYFNFGLGI